jgi:hypothetical protein
VVSLFTRMLEIRKENFVTQLDKLQTIEE